MKQRKSKYKYECQDCGKKYVDAGQLDVIEDFGQRVAPGELCPAGQCVKCGAVVHLIEPPVRVVIYVDGGKVKAVHCTHHASAEIICYEDLQKEGMSFDEIVKYHADKTKALHVC